jgi:hypothetical protein
MKEVKSIILLATGAIFFALLNVVFHYWSDWNLGLYIGQLHGVDLSYGPSKYPDMVVLNSFYGGPLKGLGGAQIIIVMSLAGYFTSRLILDLINRKRVSRLVLISTIVLWILKFPITIEYSNLNSISAGLLAW